MGRARGCTYHPHLHAIGQNSAPWPPNLEEAGKCGAQKGEGQVGLGKCLGRWADSEHSAGQCRGKSQARAELEFKPGTQEGGAGVSSAAESQSSGLCGMTTVPVSPPRKHGGRASLLSNFL